MTTPPPGRAGDRPAAVSSDRAPERRRAARGDAGAPWVGTRLRATPLATLLTAALAFVAVFLAAALPRAVDRGADRALASYLERQGPGPTSLIATAKPPPEQSLTALSSVAKVLGSGAGPGFSVAGSGPVYGSATLKYRAMSNPELTRTSEAPPLLRLLYAHGATTHARLDSGHWPSGSLVDGRVPVALSKSAADTLGAKLGTVLNTASDVADPIGAEVVGLYTPLDPADPFWTDLPCPTQACAVSNDEYPVAYWTTAALTGPEALPALQNWGGGVQDFWRLPVDTAALRADRLAATAKEIASYVAGPTANELSRRSGRSDLLITSELPRLFAQAQARRQAAAPLTAIGPAGAGGVALVVLLLAAALTADRRAAELRLLHARGGSRRGIIGRLLGESALTVLPAAALATTLAVLLPAHRQAPTLLAAGAVTLVALPAFPVRAFALLSGPRGAVPRRRLVVEALVAAATVAAVLEVRRRGVAPAGAGADPLLIAAPLLLALSAALLTARLQPPCVRLLSRLAGRGRGLIGFLGLARAAQGSSARSRPPVLPLVALLAAVTTGGFGATVLAEVTDARHQVARAFVGGDAQVAAPPGGSVPEAFTKAAGALPGVRTSLGVWRDSTSFLIDADRSSTRITVLVAEPAAYAELARTAGRGAFDAALLAPTGGPDAPLPALFSKDLAAHGPAEGGYLLRLGNGRELRARVAAVVDGSPVQPGSGAATVVLPAGPLTARVPETARPTHWFAVGTVETDRLRGLLAEVGPGGRAGAERYLVRTSSERDAELASDPLQASAERLFWVSLAGAAGFALLAVLLTLVRAAPERAALLARLRTMGLRPRQGVALILAESLPLTVAAAVGGAVAAACATALLGPAVDLTTMVGALVPTGVRLTARPVLTQALGLTALVALAVLAEAAWAGRRQITTELRAGDGR